MVYEWGFVESYCPLVTVDGTSRLFSSAAEVVDCGRTRCWTSSDERRTLSEAAAVAA